MKKKTAKMGVATQSHECGVEHWWEGVKDRDGKWKNAKSEQIRFCIRHMVEHWLGRSPIPTDLLIIGEERLTVELGGLLGKRFNSSPFLALHDAFPDFFDWSKSLHIHEWDFQQRGMWQGERGDILARTAVRHMIEDHWLGRPATAEDLKQFRPGWIREKFNLGGMLASKFKGCSFPALQHAYPEFFKWSEPNHLHEWEFQRNGKWQGESGDKLAQTAVRHMIEDHWLGRQATVEDLLKADSEIFRNELGLNSMVCRKFRGSFYKALFFVFPEFFDWSRPKHLHEWDIQHRMWEGESGDKLAQTAVRHMIEDHWLGRQATVEDLHKIGVEQFSNEFGLGGMMHTKFEGSPFPSLRHAYPEFAESIGKKRYNLPDFIECLNDLPAEARIRIEKVLRYFGDDLVDVAEILVVLFGGRLEKNDAINFLQDASLGEWLKPFQGPRPSGPKPPVDADFPFEILDRDKNGVIAGIITQRIRRWRQAFLGANPTEAQKQDFLRQLENLTSLLSTDDSTDTP